MPTDKGLILWGDKDTGPVEVTDYEGNPIRIKNMPGLTLDQEQDPDPVWENFRENMQFTITVDLDPAWYMRMVYFLRGKRQRKTALEKRKRRARHVQANRQKGLHLLQARRPVV